MDAPVPPRANRGPLTEEGLGELYHYVLDLTKQEVDEASEPGRDPDVAVQVAATVQSAISVEIGAGCAASYAADRRVLAERQRDVVEAFEQALAREVVELEREAAGGARLEVDGDLLAACARAPSAPSPARPAAAPAAARS